MFIADVTDYRALARKRLPRFLFDYIDGGAITEETLRRNVADFADIKLRQRVMIGMENVDTATEIAGEKLAVPIVLAPVGLGGINARRGEIQAATAARNVGVPFTLSTLGLCSMEEIKRATGAPFWFQLYLTRDRGFMRDMLARAKAVGCRTLLFTVDMPLPGIRHKDIRSGLSGGGPIARRLKRLGQVLSHPRWAWDVGVCGRPHSVGHLMSTLGKGAGIEEYWKWTSANFDPTVTWKDLDAVRAAWDGPLFIKGVLDVEDARAMAAVGAQGIVVSNHGGRQQDGAISSIKALPSLAHAVGDRMTLLLDGGVRTGNDVVRALALGAKAVLIGRPWAWALGARGAAGVEHVLRILEKETRVAMGLAGVTRIADVDGRVLDPR